MVCLGPLSYCAFLGTQVKLCMWPQKSSYNASWQDLQQRSEQGGITVMRLKPLKVHLEGIIYNDAIKSS